MGAPARRVGIGGRHHLQPGPHRLTAITHLHLHPTTRPLLRRSHRHPVHRPNHATVGAGFGAGGYHHPIHGCIQAHHMQWLAPGHSETFALTDREVLDAVVLTDDSAIQQHNFALTRGGR